MNGLKVVFRAWTLNGCLAVPALTACFENTTLWGFPSLKGIIKTYRVLIVEWWRRFRGEDARISKIWRSRHWTRFSPAANIHANSPWGKRKPLTLRNAASSRRHKFLWYLEYSLSLLTFQRSTMTLEDISTPHSSQHQHDNPSINLLDQRAISPRDFNWFLDRRNTHDIIFPRPLSFLDLP